METAAAVQVSSWLDKQMTMTNHKDYSDEHISAYIDGELDTDERARLVSDEQHDDTLKQRINETRLLKEKIQLAYGSADDYAALNAANKTEKTGPGRRPYYIAVAASLLVLVSALFTIDQLEQQNIEGAKQLIASTQGIAPEQLAASIPADRNIIIDLNSYRPDTFDSTLDHLQQLAATSRQRIEVVINGEAVSALDANDSPHVKRIIELAERFDNLDIIGCAASITQNPVSLLAETLTTPSTPYEVARRTAEDWLYIKLN